MLVSAAACATGVDVSQAELAEICAGNAQCESSMSGGGGTGGTGPVGVSGASGSGTSGSTGASGSTSNTGGTSGSSTGTSGSSGTGGNSGTGGSAGSANPPLQPLAKGMCMATSSVVIVYTDRGNGAAASSQATMVLHVNNTGATFDLTDLTIRYWFTDDGLGDFTSEIDYAQVGNMGNKDDVTVTFGKESGSNYATIGFSAGGPIGPEGVDQIQIRLHTNDYKMLDQSNDFSYLGSAAAVANANITPYVNGTQVGGCVPLPP